MEDYSTSIVFSLEAYATEDVTIVYGVEGEPISINCTYRRKENQWREKSWCKHVSEMECQHIVSARRFWMPFLKRRNGTTAIADNIHEGILTVTINPLRKQDAGLYQCKTELLGVVRTLQKVKVNVLAGILGPCNTFSSSAAPIMPNKTFPLPLSMISSSERPPEPGRRTLTKVQGESLSVKGFCSMSSIQAKKVWCKGDLLGECNPGEPFSFSRPGWRYLINDPDQRVGLRESENGCLDFFISVLQSEDSGIYWIGILEDLHIIPLRKIEVKVQSQHSRDAVQPPVGKEEVQTGQQNNDFGSTTREDGQRVYQLILVLGSVVVGITIIATFMLVVTVLTRKKIRAVHGPNVDGKPKQTVIKLQIHEINLNNNPPGKEMNALYAIPKKPKSTIDATYVNSKFQLGSRVIPHPNEPAVFSSNLGMGQAIQSNDPPLNAKPTLIMPNEAIISGW
ncbi:hypothetical protein JRQ81_015162 [Phrynocephalus forsythii]|uniref:Immunoglobulin domain-containing protein n=1 Tax=Phrynocephalus forsythii TaxID=171643 RepID=A0A9Q0Y1B1_9SAUR|nr:hypothetical protein JRQ81_015162 [Phrynocephalus forsythii]